MKSLVAFVVAGICSLALWESMSSVASRRLSVSLAAVGTAGELANDVFEGPKEGFRSWMAAAGMHVVDDEALPSLKEKLIKRLLMFCMDVLPEHVLREYAEDFAEVGEIGLAEPRALTAVEKFLKTWLHAESWGIRGSLRSGKPASFWDFIPDDLGRAPAGVAISFETKCWKNVTTRTVAVRDGYEVQLTTSGPKGFFCEDFYLLASASGLHLPRIHGPFGRTHRYKFKTGKLSESEIWDLKNNGVRIFLFRNGPLTVLHNLLETVLLFTPELTKGVHRRGAQRNLDFLKRYAGVEMKERRDPGGVLLNESDIRSGDFLGVIRLDGLDPVLAWAMGSHTGHTTVALWEDGELYVAESTAKGSYWPTNGIQRTVYRQWIQQAREAGFSVVHAPLAPKYRELFNESAANAAFHQLDGIDYGYGALLTGWVDTLTQNYPCLPHDPTMCLRWSHIEVLLPIAARFVGAAEMVFLNAWNLRVAGDSAANLSATEVFREASQNGLPLDNIMLIIENDSARYPNKFNNGTVAMAPAMVCDVFVCNMWKAGGLFKEIDDDFNCGEQTNNDIYNLDVLAVPQERPSQCIASDPDNNLCQLVGDYQLTLPTVGSRHMYRHMQETCPSLAPKYERPDDC